MKHEMLSLNKVTLSKSGKYECQNVSMTNYIVIIECFDISPSNFDDSPLIALGLRDGRIVVTKLKKSSSGEYFFNPIVNEEQFMLPSGTPAKILWNLINVNLFAVYSKVHQMKSSLTILDVTKLINQSDKNCNNACYRKYTFGINEPTTSICWHGTDQN
ncbi:hypothetical protein A3Q56_04993 [Intoshia linei]|uniref:Uncharacterized protein n=1 Tax=Intoshia linei TaxID=1819745 RepID=A0A177AYM4_9BILA|nr:hypothetical protein A3Q56_04993 [Intoshia linei]